ncbi:hypothetical protein ACFV2H_49870 [Streptomyces sp. NPDC059629]|uniref:hypothetical protein n=1 Tax=Streptomyces sp. NPDC059629 TaxID=3346889 RepID=UPI0036B278F0
MLARLPLVYLVITAVLTTSVSCFALDRWLQVRKLTVAFFVVSVGCCLGMIVVGGLQYQHWTPQQMLVAYSFTMTGLVIGFLLNRKLLLQYREEWRQGMRREKHEYPRRIVVIPVVTVGIMSLLGFVLAT